MPIRSMPFFLWLRAVGVTLGLLLLFSRYSIGESASPTVASPSKDGIPPPSTEKPKRYFERSYVVLLLNKVKSAQAALYIPSGDKVTVTCVTVSSNDLPDGQSLSGEIRFLSNLDGNNYPQMHVPLPPVAKSQSQTVLPGVETVFFRYWLDATSGVTQEAFNIVVTRNIDAGDVHVTVCLFGYLGDPI